jgi:hypothetical protein
MGPVGASNQVLNNSSGIIFQTAGEFRHGFAADPNHTLHQNEYRQYWGVYDFPTDFPEGVNFTIGQSDISQDWVGVLTFKRQRFLQLTHTAFRIMFITVDMVRPMIAKRSPSTTSMFGLSIGNRSKPSKKQARTRKL